LATRLSDQEEAKQRYNYLNGRKTTAELASSVDTSEKNETFRILDEANLPTTPVRPDRVALGSAGVLAGVLFGLGFAFAREFVDPTLGNEDEAAAELKLPILTSIPDIKTRRVERKEKKKKAHLSIATPSDGDDPPDEFRLKDANPYVRNIILDP